MRQFATQHSSSSIFWWVKLHMKSSNKCKINVSLTKYLSLITFQNHLGIIFFYMNSPRKPIYLMDRFSIKMCIVISADYEIAGKSFYLSIINLFCRRCFPSYISRFYKIYHNRLILATMGSYIFFLLEVFNSKNLNTKKL